MRFARRKSHHAARRRLIASISGPSDFSVGFKEFVDLSAQEGPEITKSIRFSITIRTFFLVIVISRPGLDVHVRELKPASDPDVSSPLISVVAFVGERDDVQRSADDWFGGPNPPESARS